MPHSTLEYEAAGLCIVWDAIDDIANFGLIELRDSSRVEDQCEVYFHSYAHKHLYLARLLDFAHESGDADFTGVDGSCLQVLEAACDTRCFDSEGSIQELRQSVEALSRWFSTRTQFNFWLPTLGINADLNMPRIDFLRIAGNQSKHNLSRLSRVSKRVARTLREHGCAVPDEDVHVALSDFSEHLHEHFFVYYAGWLTEMLNNIRWGLRAYLAPTLAEHFQPNPRGDLFATYSYPAEVQSEVSKLWFNGLLNHVRERPIFKRFAVSENFKLEQVG